MTDGEDCRWKDDAMITRFEEKLAREIRAYTKLREAATSTALRAYYDKKWKDVLMQADRYMARMCA